jgi:hypothetical protein
MSRLIKNLFLSTLSKEIKIFLTAFLLILSVGYFTGLAFMAQTDSTSPTGIAENYQGNENDPNATVLKFEKSSREMLTIIHTHVLSIGFIFFLLGLLIWQTQAPVWLKAVLTIEPFVSILLTFGGLLGVWLGSLFWTYVVALSGVLMTLAYVLGVAVVCYEIWWRK